MAPFNFATSQARSIYQYKKLKMKVLKGNADFSLTDNASPKRLPKLREHKCTDYVPFLTYNKKKKKKKSRRLDLKTKLSFDIRKKEKTK